MGLKNYLGLLGVTSLLGGTAVSYWTQACLRQRSQAEEIQWHLALYLNLIPKNLLVQLS